MGGCSPRSRAPKTKAPFVLTPSTRARTTPSTRQDKMNITHSHSKCTKSSAFPGCAARPVGSHTEAPKPKGTGQPGAAGGVTPPAVPANGAIKPVESRCSGSGTEHQRLGSPRSPTSSRAATCLTVSLVVDPVRGWVASLHLTPKNKWRSASNGAGFPS